MEHSRNTSDFVSLVRWDLGQVKGKRQSIQGDQILLADTIEELKPKSVAAGRGETVQRWPGRRVGRLWDEAVTGKTLNFLLKLMLLGMLPKNFQCRVQPVLC